MIICSRFKIIITQSEQRYLIIDVSWWGNILKQINRTHAYLIPYCSVLCNLTDVIYETRLQLVVSYLDGDELDAEADDDESMCK